MLQSWRDHAKWHVRELLAHLGRYYAPYSTPGVTRFSSQRSAGGI